METISPWILGVTRLMGLSLTVPFLSVIPWRIRWTVPVVFALAISGARAPSAGGVSFSDPLASAWMLGGELALGAAMGWSTLLVLGALRGAAALLADQMGLALGGAADAASTEGAPALEGFYSVVGLTVFMTLDLHHAALRIMAESFRALPPGELSLAGISGLLQGLVLQVGPHVFEAALLVGFPVLSVLLLAGLAQAVLARVLPEADFFAFGPALRSAVGLGVAFVALPFFVETAQALFTRALLAGHEAVKALAQ